MESLETIIARAALAMQLADEDLRAIFGRGEQKTYEAGAWLFHESTPRDWAGIVQAGEVDIVRGLHGSSTRLARLGPGAMIAEGALLDHTPHTTGAFTREGVVIWQIPRAVWEETRRTSPAVFYRVVARVAEGISMRLRYASEQLAGTAGAEQLIGSVRREHDLLGERELPNTAYYGVQTLRALENFPLSGIPLKNFAHFVDALAFVKKAAAQANSQLGVLDQDKMQAIGTGLNSPPGYADVVTEKLVQVSGLPVWKAADLVEATQESGAFVQMSATMKRAAVQISKICNDLRWLSSGPRCGLYEITLPPMQPGSSIMPGKVNPVIPEVVNQICFQIIGYDVVISMAAEASELELNMAEPVIAFDLLHGLMLLKNACISLTSRCIVGITANRERCRQYVENSIGLVTALNPVLGYERSAAIAKEALAINGSVYALVLQKGWLTQEALDDILKPENMTSPRQLP